MKNRSSSVICELSRILILVVGTLAHFSCQSPERGGRDSDFSSIQEFAGKMATALRARASEDLDRLVLVSPVDPNYSRNLIEKLQNSHLVDYFGEICNAELDQSNRAEVELVDASWGQGRRAVGLIVEGALMRVRVFDIGFVLARVGNRVLLFDVIDEISDANCGSCETRLAAIAGVLMNSRKAPRIDYRQADSVLEQLRGSDESDLDEKSIWVCPATLASGRSGNTGVLGYRIASQDVLNRFISGKVSNPEPLVIEANGGIAIHPYWTNEIWTDGSVRRVYCDGSRSVSPWSSGR